MFKLFDQNFEKIAKKVKSLKIKLFWQKSLKIKLCGEFLKNSDFIVDCSDNFETRKIINEYCFKNDKDLISGACIGWKGQIFNFNFSSFNSPCYECLFEEIEDEDLSCRESSIFSPLAGLIGTFLAIETIKNILEINNSEENFIEIDSLTNEIQKRIIKNL